MEGDFIKIFYHNIEATDPAATTVACLLNNSTLQTCSLDQANKKITIELTDLTGNPLSSIPVASTDFFSLKIVDLFTMPAVTEKPYAYFEVKTYTDQDDLLEFMPISSQYFYFESITEPNAF